MGYRDALEALRVQNEAVEAELKRARGELGLRQERLEQLEGELALQHARVGELEDLLGGERGVGARRRQVVRRVALVGLLALGAVGVFYAHARLEQAELSRAELSRAMEERAARQAHCEARAGELARENAMLEEQLRSMMRRFGR